MDTGQSSSTRTPACLLISTAPLVDTASCKFPLIWSVPETSSRKKMDQILKECQGCIRIADSITVHNCTEAEHDAHLWDLMHIACKYNLVFNPQKTHVKAQAINFFGCLYDANSIPPRPRQGQCCTCLASTHQCHWTPRILRSSHIPKSLYPWPIHLDCPSMRAAQEGHRLQLEPYLWHHFWAD